MLESVFPEHAATAATAKAVAPAATRAARMGFCMRERVLLGPVLRNGAMLVRPFSLVMLLLVASACSSEPAVGPDAGADASTVSDTGTADGAMPAPDGGPDAEPPLPMQTEVEPNDGKTTTEIGTMTLPGQMNGKIDPANDVDIFSVSLSPGDFWEWMLVPMSMALAPHLIVFDTAPNNLNPTALVGGPPGAPLLLQHFVLRTGSFVAAVRDGRNVPTPNGQGGPMHGYALAARRKTPAPVAVTFPATKTGTLASLGAVDLYTFTGTSGKGFDIIIRAKRKASPSTLDSRLSLFDLSAKQAIITNDDAQGTTDSEIGSSSPAASTYMVIVENEGTVAADLSYEIEFKLRP